MQEKHPQGLPDRVVKMSGERDQLMRATAQLLQKLMENARFSLFMNSTVNYELQQPRGFPGQPMAAFPGPASLGPPLGTDGGLPQTEQTIPVPESRVSSPDCSSSVVWSASAAEDADRVQGILLSWQACCLCGVAAHHTLYKPSDY